MQTMQELQSEYEQLPEVQAYDDVNATSPPKKARKTARSPGPAEAKHEEGRGIRIGSRKLKAIMTFLEHGTAEMMDAMQQHLQRHTFKGSALSDQLLATIAIYPDVHCELPDTTSSAHEVGDVGAPLASPRRS